MSEPHISTTVMLAQWERQSTAAERMCADILRIEGFTDIDPQSPLGGPDNGKDILCNKDGMRFIAACYFANESLPFARSRMKFETDLVRALAHARDCFIFMTNQKLTPGERTTLESLAAKKGTRCLIYAREHLRVVLDSPQGYGARLRHLGVGMSFEEQAAFFAASDQNVSAALDRQARSIDRLSERVELVFRGNMDFMAQTVAVVANAVRADQPGEDLSKMLQASADVILNRVTPGSGKALSANLSTPLIRYVHRLLMPSGLPLAGRWRQTQVWLANLTGQVNEDVNCPAWDKVPQLMEELVDGWNGGYSELEPEAGSGAAIEAMARFFHRLLWIHPFIDGNGRLARAILALQARDILDLREDLRLDRGAEYYAALASADNGDFSRLRDLIELAVDDAA